jgi:K+-sensing histidine kinase KdpD
MVLVCVTDQETCDRLIFSGKKLAVLEQIPLKVICVRPRQAAAWLASDEVEYLFSLSKQLDAEMVVLFHDYAIEAVEEYIEKQDVRFVLVGEPPEDGQSIFISGLEERFPHLPIITVDKNGMLQRVCVVDECLGQACDF